jgi:CheY-like chemotaxis protein
MHFQGAKFLTMQLTRMDCETTRAENGQVAIDILVDCPADLAFDMVLMDLRMPVMDGLEATRRIRTDLRMTDLPIVALTGEMVEGCRVECEGVGFDDYFQKPMKRDKLEELVNKYRERSRRRGRDGALGGMGGVIVGGGGGGGGGRATVGATPALATTTTTTTMTRVSSHSAASSGGMLRVGSGFVRTTSGTNVRGLIRRHRSRRSSDNFTFDKDRVNLAPAMVGGGNFDLKRQMGTYVNRDVEVVAFDQTTPLSVLIVEDTDVCECTTTYIRPFPSHAIHGCFLLAPHLSEPFFLSHTFTHRRQIPNHAAAEDELRDETCRERTGRCRHA